MEAGKDTPAREAAAREAAERLAIGTRIAEFARQQTIKDAEGGETPKVRPAEALAVLAAVEKIQKRFDLAEFMRRQMQRPEFSSGIFAIANSSHPEQLFIFFEAIEPGKEPQRVLRFNSGGGINFQPNTLSGKVLSIFDHGGVVETNTELDLEEILGKFEADLTRPIEDALVRVLTAVPGEPLAVWNDVFMGKHDSQIVGLSTAQLHQDSKEITRLKKQFARDAVLGKVKLDS